MGDHRHGKLGMSRPPLIWFADDWGRHPSSSQHLARQILAHRRIHWVNTIGTRKPALNPVALQRGLEKLRQWSKPLQTVGLPPHLTVSQPIMWPWFSREWDRYLNRRLLSRHLRRVIDRMSDLPIVITTLPLVADLIGRVPARRWVYYCVDDFSAWPGLDGRTLRRMEERLLPRVDRVISVSEVLQDRLRSMGRDSVLLTHGVDLEFWSQPKQGASVPELHQPGVERPLILFWGVIDRRMDGQFIEALCRADIGQVVLVGPQSDPAPELLQIPGLRLLPPQPLERLPGLAQQAAVLVMPYADLPVTRAIQPLKLKEYLATGRPCVVRDLPANRVWADCLDLADTADRFVEAVRLRIREGLPESQRQARQRLQHESWSEKARQFEQIIDE
jgi:glycosyltransferase involved in cell wall biosynthesis